MPPDRHRIQLPTLSRENESFLYLTPTGIGIELAHCGCGLSCSRSQVLLEQHTILVDDECHYSRIAVFRRIGDEGESTNYFPIHDIILRAAWSVTALPSKHVEEVTMEWRMRVRFCAVPFGGGERRQRPVRALGLAFRRLPVQTILLSCIADELQSKLPLASAVVGPRKVLGLCVGHCTTHFDYCQFIPANTACQNLFLSRCRVKEPLPAITLLQRDWKGKIISSDQ